MPNQLTHRVHAKQGGWLRTAQGMLLLAACCFAACVRAGADDSAASRFSFSAFGTLGVVHSSETQADFTSGILSANGAGYTHAWSTDVDSRIAAQIIAHVTSQLSAVVQVTSEQQYDNTYRPHVEWANIKYQLTPDLGIRAGRIVLSSFMFSDTRKVGYANPWVRPPVEVYNLVPITNSDGVDASYKLHVGDFVSTLTAAFGKNDLHLPASRGGGSSRARHDWSLSDTIERGAATLHITYQEAHLTAPAVNALFDGFRQFGPQGIALADHYDQHDKLTRFIGLGAQYDAQKWFVLGEWGHDDFHSVLGRSTAWYATGGYRWEQLTPYVTYSQVRPDGNTSDPGLDLSVLPPSLVGAASDLNAGLNAVLGSAAAQKTLSLGARWDAIANVALKVQVDHTRLGAASPGTLANLQPGFRPGGTVNLFSATVDFVL